MPDIFFSAALQAGAKKKIIFLRKQRNNQVDINSQSQDYDTMS